MLFARVALAAALVAQHESVLHALLAQLAPPASAAAVRLAVRKRAIVTLGALVAFCSPALLAALYERLLAELAAERAPALQVRLCFFSSLECCRVRASSAGTA